MSSFSSDFITGLSIVYCVFREIIRRKEENDLFNDALNTFYLRLYGVGHMVKDHSESEKGDPLPPQIDR